MITLEAMVLITLAIALITLIEARATRKSVQRVHARLDFIEQRIGESKDIASEAVRIADAGKQLSENAWTDSKVRHAELISRLP